MSPPENTGPLRTFGFGALDQATWLAGWFPGPGRDGVLLVASGEELQALPAELVAGASQGDWRVSADGAELVIAASSPTAAVSSAQGPVPGYEQGAEISGRLTPATGEPMNVTLPGRRGERADEGELHRLDSVREIAAWFGPEEVVTVTALRPRKSKGHEQDVVQAAVVDPEGFPAIVDPRVSSTYTASGHASRVGLELWAQDEERPPLRLAGEALRPGATISQAGWQLTVDWLACHRRGHDGGGVYLLVRPA